VGKGSVVKIGEVGGGHAGIIVHPLLMLRAVRGERRQAPRCTPRLGGTLNSKVQGVLGGRG
jgi:hypothetical protein